MAMFLSVLGWIFGLLIAACLLVACWPQGLGMEQWPVIAQVVSMRAGVIGIALVLLICFLGLVRWKRTRAFAASVVTMLLVFSLASGGMLASRGFGTEPAAEIADGDIMVLSWNTLGDAPGAQAIADVVRDSGADIVTLPETTQATGVEIATQLGAEGNPFWVLTEEFDPGYGALNTTLLVSSSLGAYTYETVVTQTQTLPTIVARPSNGEGPVIVATHPVAPVPNQMRNWRTDLATVAQLCNTNESVIMGGDFNSTIDHWAQLGQDGGDLGRCVDAASSTAAGAVGTWPTWAPSWIGSQIDHVVATPDWTPISTRVIMTLDDAGSDHRPILVQLRKTA